MNDDIHAFGLAPAPGTVLRRRRRLWPWLLGALLVLALLAAGTLAALWAVADPGQHGLHVIVNGQPWNGWAGWDRWEDWDSWNSWDGWDGWDGDFSPVHGLGLLLGLLVAALVVLLVVPFTLLLGLSLAVMGLAIGLAVTVGTVGVVVAVVLSPLWGLGLLLWLVFRGRRPPGARMAA